MHFCCIQKCTLSEIQSLCISFLPKKRKSDFNNEFRPGTIAIAPTRYPFRMIRFHGSQTLSFIPAAIYNRVKRFRTNVRPRPLQSAQRVCFGARTVVILHRERPALGGRSGGFSKFLQKIFRRGFLLSPDNSELYLCPTNYRLSDKGPRSARPGVLPSRTPFEPILWIPTEN